MISRIKTSLLMALLSFCWWISISQATELDGVVAEVNDSVITQSQLNNEINNMRKALAQSNTPIPAATILRKRVLDQLIDKKLQLQLAKANNITVDKAAVDDAMMRIAQEHDITLTQLPAALAKQGLDYASFRQSIQDQMIIQQLQQRELASQIKVSNQEITQVSQQLAKQPTPIANNTAIYHVQDVLIPLPNNPTPEQINVAKQLADDLASKLKASDDLQKSLDALGSSTKMVKLTDLGWRGQKDLPDLFAKSVIGLKTGEVSNPIQAPNGLHILKIAAIKGETPTVVNGHIAETHARHILIKPNVLNTPQTVKTRLTDIRNKIIHGADFAQLAEMNSEDPGSASRGGDLGWSKPGDMDPTFENQMNKLKIGEVSQPFATQFGWHIVQVTQRRQIDDTTAQRREQARQIIFQRKFALALNNWLKQLRTQAYVKILSN